MSLAAGRRDGLFRLDRASVAQGQVQVAVGSGRVELGRAAGRHIRVRWTVPALLPAGWPARIRLRGAAGPSVRSDADGVHIRTRRARLRIDLPEGLKVRVDIGRGEITSWGAGGELALTSRAGRVSCRELTCRTLVVQAQHANVHFAAAPERVDVVASGCVLALPGGPYSVTAPPDAEIEVAQAPEAVRRITVSGGVARILAQAAPLSLRSEPPGEPAADS